MAELKQIPAAVAANSPAEEKPKAVWRRAGPHLLVLALYTVLTLFYLAPLLAHFWEHVPFGGDSWLFYWDLWWVKKALVELGTNPFYSTYINFPQGASLHFHTLTFLNGALAIPLQLLGMSLPGAYNTLVVLGYIFSAYGMFLLADYVVRNRAAAWVAGLIFGFSPFHFAHLNGQLNFVTLQWMPLYVLFMLKTAALPPATSRREGWTNIGLAALFLACNALTEWTLAAFLVMLTSLYGLYRLWVIRREGRAAVLAVLRGPLLRLVFVLGLFALLTAPALLPMLNEARTNKNIKLDPQETLYYSADLLSFLTPYELHPVLGDFSRPLAEKFTGNVTERTTYVGLTPLLLALLAAGAGWWAYRRGRPANMRMPDLGFWCFSALFFAALALGPILQVGGRTLFTIFRTHVPLPYAAMYYFPFFSIMRTPARFALPLTLALALLAAWGLKWLLERPAVNGGAARPSTLRRLAGPGLVGLVSLLILFEFAPYVTTAYPNVPPIYDAARRDPDAGQAVLELPYRQAAHFYIAQVAYNKPLVDGYLARPVENPLLESNPALKTLAWRATGIGREADLKADRIRYVFVNWWMLDPDQQARTRAALAQVFDRPPDQEELEPDGSKVRISLYIVK